MLPTILNLSPNCSGFGVSVFDGWPPEPEAFRDADGKALAIDEGPPTSFKGRRRCYFVVTWMSERDAITRATGSNWPMLGLEETIMKQAWVILFLLSISGCHELSGGFTQPLFRFDPTQKLPDYAGLSGVWEAESEAWGLTGRNSRVALSGEYNDPRSPAYTVRFADLRHLPIAMELRFGKIGETTIGQISVSPRQIPHYETYNSVLPTIPLHHYCIVRIQDERLTFCPVHFHAQDQKRDAVVVPVKRTLAYTISNEKVRRIISALPAEDVDAWFRNGIDFRALDSMSQPRAVVKDAGFKVSLGYPITFRRVGDRGSLASQKPQDLDAVLPRLIQVATAIDQNNGLRKSRDHSITDISLTSELIRLHRKKTANVVGGLEFLSDGPLDPLLVTRELCGRRARSFMSPVVPPLTFFHHDNVRRIKVTSSKGVTVTGSFEFHIPQFCKGRVEFRAGTGRGSEWDILQLTIPDTPIRLVRSSSSGRWERVRPRASSTSPKVRE